MRNFIFFAVLVAVGFFAWMKVAVDLIPERKARQFVDEVRMGVDNGVIGSNFRFHPPLPDKVFETPKDGIEEQFEMERINKVDIFARPDSRPQWFRVSFAPSPLAPTKTRRRKEYKLLMVDKGGFILPEYEAAAFMPEGDRRWRKFKQ